MQHFIVYIDDILQMCYTEGWREGGRKGKVGKQHNFPPICLCECFTRSGWMREVTSIYQSRGGMFCSERSSLHLLRPARQLKQHVVPAALDFHCFNTMSFFKRGPSQAFRLNAEQTLVANSPLLSLTQSELSSNLSRHGPASVGVLWYASFV